MTENRKDFADRKASDQTINLGRLHVYSLGIESMCLTHDSNHICGTWNNHARKSPKDLLQEDATFKIKINK